jgi:hypothetical protein
MNKGKATIELEDKLSELKSLSYSSIDKLMRSIMKKYNLTAKQLHYSFVDKHDMTPDEWVKSKRGTKEMKTFKEFYAESHSIQELFGFNPPPPPAPKPATTVLAYKNYKPGILDKQTGKFTQKTHTPKEQQRYGWKPVKATSYSPGDKFTPNKVTATGEPHNWSTRNAAVPFKYKEGGAPKGKQGEPSIQYGSTLNLTNKPTGKSTKIVKSKINDVGDFGRTGNVNRDVSYDLSPRTIRDITGDNKTPDSKISSNWGKGMVYAKVTPTKPKK